MRTENDRKSAEKGGRRAESVAAFWLNLKGYRVLGRRIRTPVGELDMITVSPRGIICVVEVKARKGAGAGLEAISAHQRARIARATEYYLSSRPTLQNRPVRFDVIVILPIRLPRHVKDAWRL
jgi:putative endonuclease